MKTSNKILLGLLVVVFTVPILLATTLKSKITKGEYTVKKFEDDGNKGSMRKGTFTAFKVVKVVAPDPNLFTCHLKLADNMSFNYYANPGEDSVTVYTGNDTLFVQYMQQNKNAGENGRRGNHIQINVQLPAFNNLVVDGAVVVLDSLPASSANLSLTLKNNGEIKDGSENKLESANVSEEPVGIKTDKSTVVPAAPKTQIIVERNEVKTISKIESQMLDLNIKDLLVYGVLYRI